jgi:hypothetical protein
MQQSADARSQLGWCPPPECRTADSGPNRFDLIAHLRARRAFVEMPFHLERENQVQFAIHVGMDPLLGVFTAHIRSPYSSA